MNLEKLGTRKIWPWENMDSEKPDPKKHGPEKHGINMRLKHVTLKGCIL